MNLSILLAFGAMLSWGIGDFLLQKTTKQIGAGLAVICSLLIGLISK